jgi:hypothetical protein
MNSTGAPQCIAYCPTQETTQKAIFHLLGVLPSGFPV